MRRRRSEVAAAPGTSTRPAEATVGGFRVVRVERDAARRLVVLAPEARLWSLSDDLDLYETAWLRGSLVKAQPPADVSAERVEALRAWLLRVGAAAVRVLPPATRRRDPSAKVVEVERRSVRAVVEACAASLPSQDPAARAEVLDEALTAEGL